MIADILIDLYGLIPTGQQPEAGAKLAQIMSHSQELDRLRALAAKMEKDRSDARLKIVADEIGDLKSQIERLEIRTALIHLCHRENLNSDLVIKGLSDRCQYDDRGLTILDQHGVPVSFTAAVCSLGGDS